MRRLAIALLLVACTPGGPSSSPSASAPVVLTYAVDGGGEIRLVVQPRYQTRTPVQVEIRVRAGSIGVHGPDAAVIQDSQLAGTRDVRHLSASEVHAVDVTAGGETTTTVIWDGRDDHGAFVPASTYSLSLDFSVGGHEQRVGSVIELRAP